MGIASATALLLLVISSFSWRAQAFPEGCKKLVGSIEGAIPDEYVVKMTKGTLPVHIVKLMLEMMSGDCERKIYRTTSASNALMGPITCSKMVYIERFGFAAKMNDAAVMWLCDKDLVDYIEPSYVVTTPPTGSTVITPITTNDTSQPTSVVGTAATDSIAEDGSGITVVPETTDPPTTAATSAPVTPPPPCTKIHTYPDDTGILEGQYTVVMKKQMRITHMEMFIAEMQKQSSDPNSSMKIKNIRPAMELKMFIADLDDAALQWICQNPHVKYIDPVKSLIPLTDNSEDGSGTLVTPETTTQPTTVTTNPPTTATTNAPVTPSVKCGKMRGGALLKLNDYLIMFQYDIPPPQMNKLYTLLNLIQTLDSTFHLDKMRVIFRGPIKGFYYDGLGELAVMKLCESDLIDYIEVKAPPCTKIHTYPDDTGIIEGQYTVAMEKDMTKTDLEAFITMVQKQSSDPNSLMKVKNVRPAMELKMFIADLDDAALQWICQNPHVKYIDPMKSVIPLPDNSIRQCNNIKGTIKDSNNKCKIYVKSNCQSFVDRLSAMSTQSNRLNFSIKRISHRTPPMIIAYMEADVVHQVCKSNCVKEMICI